MPTIDAGASRAGADLWYCFPDRVGDPGLLAAYVAMLSPDERAQHQRFLFDDDRRQYLVSRALVRTALSHDAPVMPADWRFVRNRHDKPFVAGPEGAAWPSFNLSHTRGLVACVVTRRRAAVGVDVEHLDRDVDLDALAGAFFAPFEVRALRGLPPARRRERFFCYWTLKEAYVKARGLGLSIPLDQFWFHLDDGPDIAISFDPRCDRDPAAWTFRLMRASPRHLLALAWRVEGESLPLRASHVVPLSPATTRARRDGHASVDERLATCEGGGPHAGSAP